MPRSEDEDRRLRLSERDDEGDDLGYGGGGSGGGGASYDDDDEEDGGWALTKDRSEDLWDSTDEVDDDDSIERTKNTNACVIASSGNKRIDGPIADVGCR